MVKWIILVIYQTIRETDLDIEYPRYLRVHTVFELVKENEKHKKSRQDYILNEVFWGNRYHDYWREQSETNHEMYSSASLLCVWKNNSKWLFVRCKYLLVSERTRLLLFLIHTAWAIRRCSTSILRISKEKNRIESVSLR